MEEHFYGTKRFSSRWFLLLRDQDVAKYVFCGLEVGRWENGDRPIYEHKHYNPYALLCGELVFVMFSLMVLYRCIEIINMIFVGVSAWK